MLMQTPTAIDTVHAYTGMRKISLNRTTPTSPLRIFLNNNATLQVGLLDQVRSTECPASSAAAQIVSNQCRFSSGLSHMHVAFIVMRLCSAAYKMHPEQHYIACAPCWSGSAGVYSLSMHDVCML